MLHKLILLQTWIHTHVHARAHAHTVGGEKEGGRERRWERKKCRFHYWHHLKCHRFNHIENLLSSATYCKLIKIVIWMHGKCIFAHRIFFYSWNKPEFSESVKLHTRHIWMYRAMIMHQLWRFLNSTCTDLYAATQRGGLSLTMKRENEDKLITKRNKE